MDILSLLRKAIANEDWKTVGVVPMFGLIPNPKPWRAILTPTPSLRFFQGPSLKLCSISHFDLNPRDPHLE